MFILKVIISIYALENTARNICNIHIVIFESIDHIFLNQSRIVQIDVVFILNSLTCIKLQSFSYFFFKTRGAT